MKSVFGIWFSLTFVGLVASQQRFILARVPRGRQFQQIQQIQIARAPARDRYVSLGGLSSIGRLSSLGGLSSIGGLATIGLGGAFRAGGLMGGAVGLRAPQVVTLSQAGPTLSRGSIPFGAASRGDLPFGAASNSGMSFGAAPQPIFVDTSSRSDTQSRFESPDTPDLPSQRDLTPDTPDLVYAPRSMVTNAQQATAWQNMHEADGVIVI